VNGAPKGALPYREKGLLPVPVRIQVNCQRPGRIHVVRLKPGRNSLIVDLRLERVVRTQGYLGLRYGDAHEEQHNAGNAERVDVEVERAVETDVVDCLVHRALRGCGGKGGSPYAIPPIPGDRLHKPYEEPP